MTRVLLAEDDTSISEPLSRALRREGYQVEITEDGPTTLGRALSDGVDLILLDIGLPELDGLEVCRRVRAEGHAVPVLILTARADEVDTVVGLDAGADDYVTKPFRLAELLARVRALLRRGTTAEVPGTVGEVRVDAEARRAWHGDIELDLTTKEFDLLWILLRDAGKVVTREQIMREVWDAKWWTSTKTLDMHISWLRRKLGDDAHHPRFITTVRGVGFRFERGDFYMRRRLWLFTSAVAVIAALVAAVPLLVVAADRDHFMLALGLPLLAAAIAAAVALSGAVARRAARPVEELAEAAGRLGTGDPRPVGRRYGVTELDQVADGLDSASRRVTQLLTADRELAIDASHQLRSPLTALSMRLEEMIASADDPAVVREEGTAALAQAERLADVVSQLLSPARRVGAGSAGKISVDRIVLQQITEWEPAFRRAGRKMVLIGDSRLQAYVTPGGLAQVIATLLDNALMHGQGTVTIRRSQSASSVVIEVEDEGNGVPAELVSRIFERSVSGRPEGTGLGLALARTMATADGGRIVLARRKPPVFAVFLPRNPPGHQAKARRSGPA